jgi:pimeloyl-ACP methyl ester carboxylesterase
VKPEEPLQRVDAAVARGQGFAAGRGPQDGVESVSIMVEGARLHYLDQGRGSAVLLFHGFAVHSFTWRLIIPLLQARHRVIAFDLPGFGLSDRNPDLSLSLTSHAERAAALLDRLEIDRALVVGYSMGGAIAQRLAAAHPERVTGLVLVASIDASAPGSPWKEWGLARETLRLKARWLFKFPLALKWLLRRSFERQVADRTVVTTAMVDAYAEPLLEPGTAECLAKLALDMGREPRLDLGLLKVPAVLVHGTRDRLVEPSVARGMKGKIAGSRLVELEATGHLVPEERPEALAEEIEVLAAGVGNNSIEPQA